MMTHDIVMSVDKTCQIRPVLVSNIRVIQLTGTKQ